MSLFPQMSHLIPEGRKGIASIEHRTPDEFAVMMSRMRGYPLSQRPITHLYVNGTMYMSDGDNEHHTNYTVCRMARGRVLIAGLGIGMVLTKVLDKPEVTSVIVIEKFQDVIDLISPHFPHPKLTLICADIYEWKPPRGSKYDCIYFDIWADQSTDDLKSMARLHHRFKSYKADGAWMDSWNRAWLQSRKRQGA